MTKISVAMTVYNGRKYLLTQIRSIMEQLSADDELVIAYNPSTDQSLQILQKLAKQYPNIHIYENTERGLNANKEFSISKCSGEYIFLSDQDDIWFENKVEVLMHEFETNHPLLILHNCEYTDSLLKPSGVKLFADRNAKCGYWKNLVKNCYQGSCMAFHRDLVPVILPIPRDILMHDQWIGLLAERVGKVSLIEESLMYYRRHDEVTSTNHTPRLEKVQDMLRVNRLFHERLKARL